MNFYQCHWLALWGLRVFCFLTLSACLLRRGPKLFVDSHGRLHRLCGLAQFLWIINGTTLSSPNFSHPLLYDVVMGCLGLCTTLSAAHNFPHRRVKNAVGQSGTLDEKAIVTHSEMIEHSFYQGLGLAQALYLHFMAANPLSSQFHRLVALFLVTAPWLFRRCFPVHSFSANWKRTPLHKQSSQEVLLYRIKKWQYIFYKHCLLHGINIGMCVAPTDLARTPAWRVLWLGVNTSYVMEFFLQSLVKRRLLSQSEMLLLQRFLMTSASLAGVVAISNVLKLHIVAASVFLNFYHRGHDVFNTLLLAAMCFLAQTAHNHIINNGGVTLQATNLINLVPL